MENHPIPQDITGFKFKLIGSITVKQFMYLVGGSILSYLVFILPIFLLIKIPLVLIFVILSLALAFFPYDGRPLDKMVINYIKAIPSENQYIYRKTGMELSFLEVPIKHPKNPQPKIANSKATNNSVLLQQIPRAYRRSDLEKHELEFLSSVKNSFDESTFEPNQQSKPPLSTSPMVQAAKPLAPRIIFQEEEPSEEPIQQPQPTKQPSIDQIVEVIKPQEQEAVVDVNSNLPDIQEVEGKLKELQGELSKSMREKEILEKRFFEMTRQKPGETVYKPSQGDDQQQIETPHVRTISASSSITAGFPSLPDIPNIILGIVKDPRDKVLPGMIVEVLDKSNIPVRAFKTNGLGQFASATPLPNGTYHLRFEDPNNQHEFDTIEIVLTGTIFQPIEIISVDERERIRRELFEN